MNLWRLVRISPSKWSTNGAHNGHKPPARPSGTTIDDIDDPLAWEQAMDAVLRGMGRMQGKTGVG